MVLIFCYFMLSVRYCSSDIVILWKCDDTKSKTSFLRAIRATRGRKMKFLPFIFLSLSFLLLWRLAKPKEFISFHSLHMLAYQPRDEEIQFMNTFLARLKTFRWQFLHVSTHLAFRVFSSVSCLLTIAQLNVADDDRNQVFFVRLLNFMNFA